jgi:hypothetical protein
VPITAPETSVTKVNATVAHGNGSTSFQSPSQDFICRTIQDDFCLEINAFAWALQGPSRAIHGANPVIGSRLAACRSRGVKS